MSLFTALTSRCLTTYTARTHHCPASTLSTREVVKRSVLEARYRWVPCMARYRWVPCMQTAQDFTKEFGPSLCVCLGLGIPLPAVGPEQ